MKFHTHFSTYLLGLIIFGISTPGLHCLKDVEIDSPSFARRGEDVTLSCKYDMEKDLLYAVKWYRFQEEFYRFLPKESPPQKIFPMPGIQVDISRSNANKVVLKNVSWESTNVYKCVVSAESPFQTLSATKNLTILVIGYDAPTLVLDQMSYHPRDVVRANCTVQKTFPTPNVTWYIDDREVIKYSDVQQLSTPDQEQPILTSTVSSIRLELPERYEPTRLTCRVRLFDLYDESSTKRIQPIPRQYSVGGPDTLLRSNKSPIPPPIKGSAMQCTPLFQRRFLIFIFVISIYCFLQ